MLSPSLALLISIGGILILLRLKVHPGFAIFAGGLILAVLVLPLTSIPAIIYQALFNYQTARLLVIIASALTLSRLMEGKGLLAELATAMESIKQATSQNVASMGQVETSSQSLNELSQKLKELIGQYTVA